MRTGLALAGAIFALFALASRRKAAQSPLEEPPKAPPSPADLPSRPGGLKPPSPLTSEMGATASAILATHPPVGSVIDLGDFGLEGQSFVAFVTYHLKDGAWVRAVEIWERT